MIGHYMVYETFHFCCHVPENCSCRVPLVNTIRRHHRAHHNMGIMMHVNMNLTFPIADWAMDTSDLKRGLLGHLFNGYGETHVKDELKPVMARFRSGETQEKRGTLDGPKLSDDELQALHQAGSAAPDYAAFHCGSGGRTAPLHVPRRVPKQAWHPPPPNTSVPQCAHPIRTGVRDQPHPRPRRSRRPVSGWGGAGRSAQVEEEASAKLAWCSPGDMERERPAPAPTRAAASGRGLHISHDRANMRRMEDKTDAANSPSPRSSTRRCAWRRPRVWRA